MTRERKHSAVSAQGGMGEMCARERRERCSGGGGEEGVLASPWDRVTNSANDICDTSC